MTRQTTRGVGFTLAACGLIGLAVIAVVNLVALLILGKPSAFVFTSAWWAQWAPNYSVWVVLSAVGGGLMGFGRFVAPTRR